MESYQRQQGDFELRILPDGRLVMLAPDENLIALAKEVEKENLQQVNNQNREADDAAK
jgi:hypothetical protein